MSAGKETLDKLENGVSELSTEKQQIQPAPSQASSALLPNSISTVKVKDEPVDEEYEQAMAPQAPAGGVKVEPETAEECGQQQKATNEFKISAVFSVGQNPASIGSTPAQTAAAVPPPKAVTPSSAPMPSLASASSLCVVCSGCTKVLLKGQTAYQRKGSSQLYCSTACLTRSSAVLKAVIKKTCHYCLKEIMNPKDVIIAPVDSAGAVKDFCSQKCLSGFNYKRSSINSDHRSSRCSVCQKFCITRHEVTFMGAVHKLCGDTCFTQFRSSNKLTMNCCVNCGGYCYTGEGKSPTLKIDGNAKKFCSQSCVSIYKKKSVKPVPCTLCRVLRAPTDMVESPDSDGTRELFCSAACVTAHKVQTISSSGTAQECNNCKVTSVPQYHLAMSDGSIRNFCSFTCVVAFQEAFNKANKSSQVNVTTSQTKITSTTQPAASVSTPSDPPSSTTASTKSPSGVPLTPKAINLTCKQCRVLISSRPELVEFKFKMFAFCDKSCAEEFRKINSVLAPCVYCKIEKVVREVKRINKVDCTFCSEGCKLLYKHDLAKRWGKKHCRSCHYCGSTSQSLVTGVFSGKTEEFCGNECLSLYTLLFCQVAKCNVCQRAQQMKETVRWLGEVKHFCDVPCLLQFCSQQNNVDVRAIRPVLKPSSAQSKTVPIPISPVVSTAPSHSIKVPTPVGPKEATPVIASVISLSNTTNGQPSVLANTALQGTVPAPPVKVTGHASTQTDSVRLPPTSAPRILKNKALLCKPMSQTKGTMCKPNTEDTETQTDEDFPKVIVLPLPVPVYVPVPMHLYTQYTPQPLGLPLPVPVPMFLPTTLSSAEGIVQTIQKIKEKIPDDPFEADLIMMAEMVAEQNERGQRASHRDQASTVSEDLDLEPLSSAVSCEDESSFSSQQWSQISEPEGSPSAKRTSETLAPSPEQGPQVDLEADFPIECFELYEEQQKAGKEQQSTPAQNLRTHKRTRDSFPQRKRARKRSAAPATAEVAVPPVAVPNMSVLQQEYGVNAWKSWVRWRTAQPNMDTPKLGSRPMKLKEDMLQCSTAELSYGLYKFVSEVRRPNGESYSPDSIFYLCLGIQQYLFENGRLENIFSDVFYSKFTQEITRILKDWKPTVLPSGYIHSRVEEEYLWQCKQLGAYSPSVLLNTLLFFCTKMFKFKTVAQHQRLSFAHVMRCTRPSGSGKVSFLRFYPPTTKRDSIPNTEKEDGSSKRKREDEEDNDTGVLEMPENTENPLRCPVRLYEFYLSKCSTTMRQRTNVFYLQPERSCISNSPMWFSSMALDSEMLEGMLTRILIVRQLHLETEPAQGQAPDSDHNEHASE
ncbi:zinc finger MYM-type protein 4 [Chanos chanos]|uniref:Zinc finger MYM-type protein 4 n=1 Tax=Chanos chanos TaxID=29144 RepID=A0A6J2WM52_CHACN|nr:zinc finger MYM-type protein 4 [Chanos chanos]